MKNPIITKSNMHKMFYYTKFMNNIFAYTHAQQTIALKLIRNKKINKNQYKYDTMNYNQYYKYGKKK